MFSQACVILFTGGGGLSRVEGGVSHFSQGGGLPFFTWGSHFHLIFYRKTTFGQTQHK